MSDPQGFNGLRVVAFESRMAEEMARLITRHGGEPHVAPSMREIPLEDNAEVFQFGERLFAGEFGMVILLTGVGTRTMVAALKTRHPLDTIKASLGHVTLVARGPKPIAALRELGLTPEIAVPEPNTWRDLLHELDRRKALKGLSIAVQEYGISNPELLDGLRERGAEVTRVPVYRWALPADTGPLRQVLDAILASQIDVVLVTNAAQVDHVMQLLAESQQEERFRQVMCRMVVASIGEIASERLHAHGLPVDLEPSRPKMGILVKEASEQARVLLQKKASSRN